MAVVGVLPRGAAKTSGRRSRVWRRRQASDAAVRGGEGERAAQLWGRRRRAGGAVPWGRWPWGWPYRGAQLRRRRSSRRLAPFLRSLRSVRARPVKGRRKEQG